MSNDFKHWKEIEQSDILEYPLLYYQICTFNNSAYICTSKSVLELMVTMDRNVSCTSRSGTVSKITPEDIAVNIISVSACFACRSKELCSAFERKEKTVFVPNAGQKVQCGDKVNVVMETGMGIKAALLAYFMPVIFVTAILFLLIEAGTGELYAGIISLVSLAGYYSVIYLFRAKLKKHFTLYIEKQTEN